MQTIGHHEQGYLELMGSLLCKSLVYGVVSRSSVILCHKHKHTSQLGHHTTQYLTKLDAQNHITQYLALSLCIYLQFHIVFKQT